ncbi:hypothetical protein KSF_084170 [Reticulibacter mediterranei]|uniref:Uncharacterized protein n=1 Tax=Reticulibacter mediterranei TaxID=2778369 RepID=A0A8J3IMK2_9CHLR|nr:hypothetical protein [Reticulibacter mediterranei]GHO98369.1 hypothetical protein KSF_084170 [Reticulibacter mediterranei]
MDIESILRSLARGENPELPDGTTGVNVNGNHVSIYTDGGGVSADVDANGNVSNLHGHLYGISGSRDRLDLDDDDLRRGGRGESWRGKYGY